MKPTEMKIPCRDELVNSEITSDYKSTSVVGWRKRTKSTIQKTCTVELLKKRFPIVTWLPTYNWSMFVFDMIAGLTVGLTLIPQSIGYAAVAGLPLQVIVININS
jgi:hypothetical protein